MIKEKIYPAGFIGGGARGLHHFTEMVGSDCCVTINWNGTADELIRLNPPVVQRFFQPTPYSVVNELLEKVDARGIAQVVYTGKNSRVQEKFAALDWAGRRQGLLLAHASRLARLVTHIPNKGEQLVRYYGFYSNKARGVRKKAEAQELKAEGLATSIPVPCLFENDMSRKTFHKNWARLIQKVYHTDPLVCPKCHGSMRIISIIEEEAVIKQILVHLNLWMTAGNTHTTNAL